MRTDATPADNLIPFELAAKALKVSRRTVERMVADGRLEAAEGATVRSVTRRSLVAALGDDTTIAQTSAPSAQGLDGAAVIALLDQLQQAQKQALEAVKDATEAKAQLRQLEAAKDDLQAIASKQDALVEVLLNGTRRERRAARKEAKRLRQE